MFDPANVLFYLLRANFSNPGFDGSEPILLYVIDPKQGSTVVSAIQGASGLVTGMHYNKNMKMIQFATYHWSGNQKVGYDFYLLDPKSTVAKQVSTIQFGTVDNYCGWFKETSEDGTILYRLGFQDAPAESGFGLGLTDISQSTATTVWVNNFTIPSDFNYFDSFTVYKNTFYSLAEDSSGALSLVKWSLDGPATVVATLGDAYLPTLFGEIAEALNADGTMYYALVVHEGIIPIETDRWALASVDLTNNSGSTVSISPWMIAGTDSLSGFGIAN
uniref:Uncharacterized protein n=1 Tax=Arcella intermedia TaxID=1963864 RepID=A0A6B2LBY9_9EUKA